MRRGSAAPGGDRPALDELAAADIRGRMATTAGRNLGRRAADHAARPAGCPLRAIVTGETWPIRSRPRGLPDHSRPPRLRRGLALAIEDSEVGVAAARAGWLPGGARNGYTLHHDFDSPTWWSRHRRPRRPRHGRRQSPRHRRRARGRVDTLRRLRPPPASRIQTPGGGPHQVAPAHRVTCTSSRSRRWTIMPPAHVHPYVVDRMSKKTRSPGGAGRCSRA